ncbi:hypothetical protein [Candidatus Hydrogenosomobacter endosymbioticus]|uniref:Uncharacterized protein n=1 Tax=Candidatus Hydrogenosomobacter endosymbioticus TaxID=2558174 RepID=A0ABN6L3L7_9PROT|nr:hypothetical protein [Candidatus Hydrogenosomobacter endosymbioticus]BDB96502.1 hypothetical protein HYD_6350 [Candidatus Hydrogenosomobacter endosymbioticus]
MNKFNLSTAAVWLAVCISATPHTDCLSAPKWKPQSLQKISPNDVNDNFFDCESPVKAQNNKKLQIIKLSNKLLKKIDNMLKMQLDHNQELERLADEAKLYLEKIKIRDVYYASDFLALREYYSGLKKLFKANKKSSKPHDIQAIPEEEE